MNLENKLYEQICNFLLKNKKEINYISSFQYSDSGITYHYFVYKSKEIRISYDKDKILLYDLTKYNLEIDNFWIKPTILLESYESLCKYLNDKGNREIEKKKKIEEMNNSHDENFNNLLKSAEEEHYKKQDSLHGNEDYECDYSKDVWLG